MFRTFFHGANDYVEMTEEVDRSVLVKLGKRRRRLVLTAMTLVLALLVLAPWAASTPAVFQWLSRVAPPVAHFLRPTAGSEEADGIRVQVVEASREGDTLHIHLTLEDLQGDRLGSKTSPEYWYYEQGRTTGFGACVPYYDQQTGLLHLNLSCQPTEEFDWDRWITLTIESLQTLAAPVPEQIPIPITPGDELDIPVGTELNVKRMVVEEDEFRVFVGSTSLAPFRSYRMLLTGPNGEQLHLQEHVQRTDGTWWVFALRGRSIDDCTLSVWLDPRIIIDGPWTIQVSPQTAK